MDRDTELATLLDRERIRAVIHDLARGTDRLDRDLMASCYHPDGFDDHGSFQGSGDDFADWVVRVLSHFDVTHHKLGQCRIEVDGSVARVETYCDAHHVSKPDADGKRTDIRMGLRYVDRFEKRDGTWKIAKRVCAFDWAYTVVVDDWPWPEGFVLGRRDRGDITYEGV